MVNVDEEYEELASDLGLALESISMPRVEIAYIQSRLPPRLVKFLSDTGSATYLGGAVTVCEPSKFAPVLELVFKGDNELTVQDCTLVSYGAFGDLSVWSNKFGLIDISLIEGLIFSQGLAPSVFPPELVPEIKEKPNPDVVASYSVISKLDDVDCFDFYGQEMFERCVSAVGTLSLGECYEFSPPLPKGGVQSRERVVENVRKAQALEHFSFLAQRQSFCLAKFEAGGVEKVREVG